MDGALRDADSRKNINLICVEGFMSSGKTPISMKVASRLNGFRVSTDCYINDKENFKNYSEKLHIEYLTEDILKLKKNYNPLLLEGICLREVLSWSNIEYSGRNSY